MNLWMVAAVVLGVNVPFGYWRDNVPKYSKHWFLAIHLPVPIVIALRLMSGLGWRWVTFPVLIGAFFTGQFLGGLFHSWRKKNGHAGVGSCLVMDLIRGR